MESQTAVPNDTRLKSGLAKLTKIGMRLQMREQSFCVFALLKPTSRCTLNWVSMQGHSARPPTQLAQRPLAGGRPITGLFENKLASGSSDE